VCTAGVFTRITLLSFVLPIWIAILYETCSSNLPAFIRLWTPAITTAAGIAGTISALDSLYFRSSVLDLVITPLNFLKYNLSLENLNEHGIHPRWLHSVVNFPIILGPSLLIAGARAGWQVLKGNPEVKENRSRLPMIKLSTSGRLGVSMHVVMLTGFLLASLRIGCSSFYICFVGSASSGTSLLNSAIISCSCTSS
jgi:hypothetical protein